VTEQHTGWDAAGFRSDVETTLQDIRYGLRALRKYPAFSAIAIATLAVGIGAGTSVFSVVGAVLLRPLPYRNPGELVRIFETNPLRRWTRNIAAPANWADWQVRNKSFTGIAAYEQFSNNGSGASEMFLTGFGEPQGVKNLGVSGNFFEVLGAVPLLGRTFTEDEQYEGKARVAVLSYGLWQAAFNGQRTYPTSTGEDRYRRGLYTFWRRTMPPRTTVSITSARSRRAARPTSWSFRISSVSSPSSC